jgi:hypothetical protein
MYSADHPNRRTLPSTQELEELEAHGFDDDDMSIELEEY